MLALGVLTQAAGTILVSTPAFLIPLLHTQRGLTLSTAGLIASAPTLGMVLTLVAWGALADRVGERWVIAAGSALAALAAGAAALSASSYPALGVFLLVAGMASASANAASGRLVVGWFPRSRRGLAMGIRQMAQPLGVAVAAVTVPSLAARGGTGAALTLSVIVGGVLAIVCAMVLRDPARPPVAAPARSASGRATRENSSNPYRASGALWRIHAVSMLLVVPQFTLSTFGLVWLLTDQSVTATLAGLVIGLSQFVGAVGRIGIGVLSDRVGSRMRPLRWVSIAAVAVMVALAALDWLGSSFAIAALVVATTVSVADNGLAFTAVAEIAGPQWAGRALGVQNTGQFIAASAVGPLAGLLIGVAGYPVTFLASAACALVALPLVPRKDAEHPSGLSPGVPSARGR
jgi:MFS family permease